MMGMGWLVILIIGGLVVWAVLYTSSRPSSSSEASTASAERILADRFARGEIDREASSTDPLPEHLSDPGFSSVDEAVNPTAARTIVLSFARGTWMLNGRTFQMTEVSPEETVQFGSTELWKPLLLSRQARHTVEQHPGYSAFGRGERRSTRRRRAA